MLILGSSREHTATRQESRAVLIILLKYIYWIRQVESNHELRFTKILRYVPARRIGALFRLDPKVRGRKRGLYEIFM